MCKTLGRDVSPTLELESLATKLDEAYQRTVSNLPDNATASVVKDGGQETLTVSGLEKLDEPSSLLRLKENIRSLMPSVDRVAIRIQKL